MRFTRRHFLKSSLGAAASLAGLGMPEEILGFAPAINKKSSSKRKDTILVVLELTGGNDGLNTIIPYNDDVYIKSRPTLRIKPEQALKINGHIGFHPVMDGFMSLYREGLLTIIQEAGYKGISQDHAIAMRTWQTGEPENSNCRTGWLGRTADQFNRENRVLTSTVFVGNIAVPFTLNAAQAIVPAIQTPSDLCLEKPFPAKVFQSIGSRQQTGRHNELLETIKQGNREALSLNNRIERHSKDTPYAGYPPFGLSQRLQVIAGLIRAETGIRIYYTDLGGGGFGGFDNHANQAENHAALLKQLSRSVTAFLHDLRRDKLLDRVLLMTFSEFGRTVKENGRRGTGHGCAAPLFLAGGRVRGGLVGKPPDLANLYKGGVKCQFDFRRVYATVLKDWLGVNPDVILERHIKSLPGIFS